MNKSSLTSSVFSVHAAVMLCLMLAFLSCTPVTARGRHRHRTCRPSVAVMKHRRPALGSVVFARPLGGKYCRFKGHRCWLADGVVYDIVKVRRGGVKYVVVQIIDN